MRIQTTIFMLFFAVLSSLAQQVVNTKNLLENGDFAEYFAKSFRVITTEKTTITDAQARLSIVINPDGGAEEIKIIKGLLPKIDKEILRILKLYKNWKNTLKDHDKSIIYTIDFSDMNIPYISSDNVLRNFLDANVQPVADETTANYKIETTIDTTRNCPIGHRIMYQKKGKKWKEMARSPFIQSDVNHFLPIISDSVLHYKVQLQDFDDEWVFYENNTLLGIVAVDANATNKTFFYRNGALMYHEITTPAKDAVTTWWHQNGQLKSRIFKGSDGYKKIMEWNIDGKPTVIEGNGESETIATFGPYGVVQKGKLVNNKKEGLWKGYHRNGTLFFEETFVKDSLIAGKAYYPNKVVSYSTNIIRQPLFGKTPKDIGQFLAKNMRYPVSAAKSNVQGKVWVNFLVNENGEITNIKPTTNFGFGLEEEAIRVIKLTAGQWRPASLHGVPVKVNMKLPLSFVFMGVINR